MISPIISTDIPPVCRRMFLRHSGGWFSTSEVGLVAALHQRSGDRTPPCRSYKLRQTAGSACQQARICFWLSFSLISTLIAHTWGARDLRSALAVTDGSTHPFLQGG